MLNEKEFKKWCVDNKINNEGCAFIKNIREGDPSRKVGGGTCNVHGFYSSQKMGRTIQFESHSVELPYIYELEHDDNVVEFYDQPALIKLIYVAASGKNVGHNTKPDYLVIENNCGKLVECKTEEQLEKLAIKSPNKYIRDENGNWRCPPGEEFAAKLGLTFQVVSSGQYNRTFQRNLLYLQDYSYDTSTKIDEEVKENILSCVKTNQGITLKELILDKGFKAEEIYLLIAREEIYCDLYDVPIKEHDLVHIFTDIDTAKAFGYGKNLQRNVSLTNQVNLEIGKSVKWDGVGYTIIHIGDQKVKLKLIKNEEEITTLTLKQFHEWVRTGEIEGYPEDITDELELEVEEMLKNASPTDLKIANKRWKVIEPKILYNKKGNSNVPGRTQREWEKNYRDADKKYGNGFVGLLPMTKNKGNRNGKLDPHSKALMEKCIEDDYEYVTQSDMITVFRDYNKKCEESGTIASSYKTFTLAVHNKPQYTQLLKRQGRKAAYNHEEFFWDLSQSTPRHGDRPFEIAHIDHTELIVECVNEYGEVLGRPWLTLLVDANTRKILAFHLDFNKPSSRSCMMVIRDCVRRYNRLPDYIVVDGGKEFQSVYFDTLLANYRCGKKVRPASKARNGSVGERLFGKVENDVIKNLLGNTQMTQKYTRVVVDEVNPKNLAVWDLKSVYELLEEYFFNIYETRLHPALETSPRNAFEMGIKLSGSRSVRFIPYNHNFLIMTLPTTKTGTVTIDNSRGVKINNRRYWAPALRDPLLARQSVPVRYDPLNIGLAYVYINNEWVQLKSEHYYAFNNRTEKEIQIATKQLLQYNKLFNKESITAKQLADFMISTKYKEELLIQRKKDAEASKIYDVINKQTVTTENLKNLQQEETSEYNKVEVIDSSTLPLFEEDYIDE